MCQFDRLSYALPFGGVTFAFQVGSVVIIVQGTGFRLHSSTLSMESSYFKDLLSNMDIMAVDSDDDVAPPRLDGRPVYELTNVTMSDFENLLKSFRDGMYVTLFLFFASTSR